MLDDLFPNTVGLGNLKATHTRTLNPEFNDSHSVPVLPNISAVSIQGIVNRK
jgi:hypothetical protein